MNALKWFDKVLARVEGWLIIAFLWLMVIFTFIQVCLRGLYTHAHFQWANALMGHLDWSEPFVRLLVLWLTFLGASLVTRENRHIRIDLMGSLVPPKWLCVREFILSIVCVLVSAIMLKVCIDYVKMEMEFGGTLFYNFPVWIGELIIPAGFALILFRFLLRGIDQGIETFRGQNK
ncbi:MAG: TRAP transporter small permease [Deltaproteobacteria bacterium]|nr:TRAP transporter small permease [Deltaproteobacteria bacterium]